MEERTVVVEDDEREALAALSGAPRARKNQSYSQQLRATTAAPKRHHAPHHQPRKHSLDDSLIPPVDHLVSSSSDDDDAFFPHAARPAIAAATAPPPAAVLPEFVGSGGGAGIFKVPTRAAVHPGRPPCLELRPHPLRETQVGKFLRNIACSERQLWAGHESGLRVCRLGEAYEPGCGLGGGVMRGDEDAAPFHESATTSPIMCLLADDANRLLWSGHKDGKIRSWRTDNPDLHHRAPPFKEGLSWLAHRGPVLAIAITFHGDLWSGSEGGVIRVWPWESIDKSLSFKAEERYMAALLVERSFIDLRAQVTVNGVCSISSQDLKCLVADNARAKVWCAGSLSFSLWDARTRQLIKVFNIDGQIENRVDMSSVQQDPAAAAAVEDEMRVKFMSASKKEKSGGGFLQRSRNAIMGAADAVRRVATRGAGALVEDATRRTEALVLAADGTVWSGCTNGLLVQWDGNGNRVRDLMHHPCAVQCFCAFGARIYIGYASGLVQVMGLDGGVVAGWVSHSSPVIKLAAGSGHVFSLATHGGIRGWNITSPGPIDAVLRAELATKEKAFTKRDNVKVVVGTWNVGQGRASHDALMSWLGSAVQDVGIVVVGLQEVEMGAGFLAMSAAKETVGLEGSSMGQWWLDNIGKALEEGKTFERMGSRQLAGLLISLWVRKNLRTHVGDIDAGAVPCGFGRAIGNKGGVGLRIRVYDRIMCFVNCHLAAHLEAVNRRNADFDHIYRNMVFNRSSNFLNNAAAGVTTAVQMLRGTNAMGGNSEEARPELAEADMVVFLGDFNYRLFGISYDEARDFVSQRCFDWLREKDQLRAEMKAGKVFQGMREALIKFPPTYKFERHRAGLSGYDSGEKKRIPAWCDRIIYRDNRSASVSDCTLECPVVASVLQYEACMDVTDSDHKPVRCKFDVQIAHVDRSVRRKEFGRIFKANEKIQSMLEESSHVPETTVSTDNIVLQNQDTFNLRIVNKSADDSAIFRIVCDGYGSAKNEEQPDYLPRRSFGFPRWLEVTPGAGIIKPEQTAEVSVRHEEFHTLEEFVEGIPQNWWSEDTRDKEVTLAVNVQGSCSLRTTSHKICVRHCFSSNKALRVDASSSSRGSQPGSSHLSDAEKSSKMTESKNDGFSRQ